MALKRLFLTWDKPLLSSAALELLQQAENNIFFDLSNILVVVPTSHSIKTLSYKLTEIAIKKGCAVLPPKFVTPQFFFANQACEKVSSETQRILFWIEAIKLNMANLKSLFPGKLNADKNLTWYLDKAEKIIELTDILASIGMTIEKMIAINYKELQNDLERFVELSQIEASYFQLLSRAGLEDINKVKIKNALTPKLPKGVTKVIFIAVPDPIPIITETISILSLSTTLEIWINAPSNFDSAFDVFGRPIVDFWRDKNLNIPDFKNRVALFDSPRDLVSNFINLVSEKNDSGNNEINIDNISIVIPDTSLEPAIRYSFSKHGIKTYNPSGVSLGKTQTCILFNAILEFMLLQDYHSLSSLIRNADFLAYIKFKIDSKLNYSKFFSINDYLQNKYMPISFVDMLNATEMENKRPDKYTDKISLTLYSKILAIVKDLLIKEDGRLLTESALSKIIEIYNVIQADVVPELKADLPDSINAIRDIVCEVKQGFDDTFSSGGVCTIKTVSYSGNVRSLNEKNIAFFTQKKLQNTTLYPPQDDGTLPLRGWLELQWEEKKTYTFVLGMNEGVVPAVTAKDIFLPDSLKKKLNLPCNDSRFARDSYILYSVIESQTKYPMNFIVMKTNNKGEYLKPSRLLLQTSDQNCFYERLNYLFRGNSVIFEQEKNTSSEFNHYPLNYSIPFKKLKENKLSVTDFKSYLECPFRFYLKKYLGFEEEIDDTKTNLDNREFGSICHEILKSLGEKLRENADEKELRSLLAKELVYERSKFSPSIPVEFSFYSLEQRLNKALTVMLEEAKNGKWKIQDLEKDFNIVINSDKLRKWLGNSIEEEIFFSIRGRVDRIDISRDGKSLRVIDYKTGSVSVSPQKEHYKSISARTNKSLIKEYAKFEINGKEYVWIDLQLPLYAIILQELPEYENLKINSCAYFVIPKAVTDTKIVLWSEILEQELDAARKCAAQIILNIANGIFWPPSENVKYDNYQKILYSNSFENYISFGNNDSDISKK